jgi:hypothetical protein
MALLSLQPGKRPRPSLVVLPFIAALLDWAENTAHLILLRDLTHISAAMVLVASIAAAIKWCMIAISVVVVLHLIVTSMHGRMPHRG